MGFLSDLFNIESSHFKTISKPTAIKEFSTENGNLKVLNELLLRLNSNNKRQLVNKEIIAIKMGLKGESTVDFELRNCTFPFLYLHDIRIEYDDLVVQIDYLVITKKYICVMETKQLLGDVNINKDGEFIRAYKSKSGYENKTGMYSPIEQNKKHVNLIKKILKDVFDADKVPVKSIIVMANPAAIIRKTYASKEIQNQIIRAEKLSDYFLTLNNDLPYIVLKEATAFKIANYLKEKHTPINIDYQGKFGLLEKDFIAESNSTKENIKKEIKILDSKVNVPEELIVQKIDIVPELSESDKQMTEDLKVYRNQKAKEEGYKGFQYHCVFSASTIGNIVEIKPQTIEQLFQVRGLAQLKINKYGNDILKITRKKIDNDPHLIKEMKSAPIIENKEDELRNKLKQFRSEISAKESIRPYLVFSNQQMEEVLNAKPITKDQLSHVSGFGEIKVEKYADGIVNIFK
ncbi:HRDC domain-containing protein [Clostridium estertheticum]|uniref:HRDC domain-containing protein n=1 Tax=Clostridium estertheticum TaxID=238834 RepID=UPI001C6ED6D3|nr:HRDC domain-containing protein [Clostridium estertheticum]MBW9173358.1 HRDC domain-containing protein [Clostridium estertheticum]WLC73382.1 HRDC domain-containing protein [Clostridium estertheticum]